MFDSICFAMFALHRRRFEGLDKELGVRNGLLINPIALRQRSQTLSAICIARRTIAVVCDAPVVNLAHSASSHSRENTAPSNQDTKHLAKPEP